jgi:MinD-like ATPase involved in chromosome partitioning or flagellar assembly/tetratricopeptide (TPR) repeat protein
MYTVTFYSYRGGVGRTTALVNSAFDLALRGRKVLLVDFDLEAPSLPSFVPLRPEDGAHLSLVARARKMGHAVPKLDLRPEVGTHPGLVEFIDEYLRSGKAPDIRNFIYQAKPIHQDCADVWVMPAGRGDDDYWRAYHAINWKDLFGLRDGFVLFEDIKFQWRELFHPDYVLVDARAGINDRLAICTRQLPDAVALVFTPDAEASDQAGLQRVVDEVVTESMGPNRRRIERRIDILFVASKVPDLDGEEPDLGRFGVYFEDPLDADKPEDEREGGISFGVNAAIPHAPERLLDRQATDTPRPRKRLHRAYRKLADAIIGSNCTRDRDGARAFLKRLQQHPNDAVGWVPGEKEERWWDTIAKLDQVISNFDRDPDVLAQAASCLFLAGRYDEAMKTLDDAIDIAPTHGILWQRASYRRRLKLPRAVDDLLRLLDAPAPAPSRHLDSAATWSSISEYLRSPESPELDTTSLDTSDPLTRDFSGIDPYVASAFQQLRRLGREAEALQKPRIQQLPPDVRQALITDTPLTAQQNPRWLARTGQWPAAIARLEPRIAQASAPDPWDLFDLSMAYWGTGNEARATELCQSARAIMLEGMTIQPDVILHGLNTDELEEAPFLSLMFWRAGDCTTAERFLDRCDELLADAPEADSFFSFWRMTKVTRRQFELDCHSQRQMIKGAAIRPYFLGKEPGVA